MLKLRTLYHIFNLRLTRFRKALLRVSAYEGEGRGSEKSLILALRGQNDRMAFVDWRFPAFDGEFSVWRSSDDGVSAFSLAIFRCCNAYIIPTLSTWKMCSSRT